MRRFFLQVFLAFVPALPGACESGKTTGAANVTATLATLNATGHGT